MPRGVRRRRRGVGRRQPAAAPTLGLPGAEEMATWKAADETRQQQDATRAFREAERQPWERGDRDRGERDRERPPMATPGAPPLSTPTPPPTPTPTPVPYRSAPPPPTPAPFDWKDFTEEQKFLWMWHQRSQFLANQARAQAKPPERVPGPYDWQPFSGQGWGFRRALPPGWQSDTDAPQLRVPWGPAGGWEAYPAPQADPNWRAAPQGGTF